MEAVKSDLELLSNSMAAYAHIKANPESLALYFVMGVCCGLFMALCLLVAGVVCRTRLLRPPRPEKRQLKESSEEDSVSDEDGEEAEAPTGTMGPLSECSSQSNGTLKSLNVFSSVEELEKARRLEERERIVREIWRNGQPDILVTGTGTIGRVHYR